MTRLRAAPACGLVLATVAATWAGSARPAQFLGETVAWERSYAQELTVRLWGGIAQLEMYDARVAIRDENTEMRRNFFLGGVNETSLKRALHGGLEVSYGWQPDVKLLLALEGRGVAAKGGFEGVASALGQEIKRVSRYTAFGQEVGASVLLRAFGGGRFALTARGGVHELIGAQESGQEYGPIRTYWWKRKLSGIAPGFMVGLEWEWLGALRSFPLSGFMIVGYRVLQFDRVRFEYSDTTGLKESGGYKGLDGKPREFNFTGLEARFGVQVLIPYASPSLRRRAY